MGQIASAVSTKVVNSRELRDNGWRDPFGTHWRVSGNKRFTLYRNHESVMYSSAIESLLHYICSEIGQRDEGHELDRYLIWQRFDYLSLDTGRLFQVRPFTFLRNKQLGVFAHSPRDAIYRAFPEYVYSETEETGNFIDRLFPLYVLDPAEPVYFQGQLCDGTREAALPVAGHHRLFAELPKSSPES